MEDKTKKIFTILALQFIFFNSFPFFNIQIKHREEKNVIASAQSVPKEENPDFIHPTYSIEVRNSFVAGITSTATVISDFVHDIFYPKR